MIYYSRVYYFTLCMKDSFFL